MTDQAEPNPPETAAEGNELAAALQQVEDLKNQLQAAKEAHLRSLAELDNVRKRAEREIDAGRKFGAEKLLSELLGIVESVDLGLVAADKPDASAKTIAEGLEHPSD